MKTDFAKKQKEHPIDVQLLQNVRRTIRKRQLAALLIANWGIQKQLELGKMFCGSCGAIKIQQAIKIFN